MNRPLTDADVVTFVLAGCSPDEIAAYSGTDVNTAKARMAHARMDIARQGGDLSTTPCLSRPATPSVRLVSSRSASSKP
jgi:hypothetical protein